MRRAVAEQIKALQDLSAIIGRSSNALEFATPTARQPAAASAAAALPTTALPAGMAAGVSATIAAGLPQAAPLRASAQPEPREALRGSLGLDRATQPAQQPRLPTADAAAADYRPRQEEGGGWVRDLLRAASREEAPAPAPRQPDPQPQPARPATEARNPRHVVESLNSLSVDIARAIDHDASVDLWRRYQRGERDVFTRRLYTLKGQQTFDEIKRKYDREPEFRTAVDRYIGDFEKLLSDVARNDRDRTMTQSYLTSDTGKVYTMLAHAAGRFS